MEAVEEFLSKGIETYLDAQSAVRVFESEVQQRIKAQIVKHDLALKDWWGEHLSLRITYILQRRTVSLSANRCPSRTTGVFVFTFISLETTMVFPT